MSKIMRNDSLLTIQRKRVKKHRLSISISDKAYQMLVKMHEEDAEVHVSSIIADAIVFMYESGARKRRYATAEGMEKIGNKNISPVGSTERERSGTKVKTREDILEEKKGWCMLCGGDSPEGTTCRYTKYEIAPTGQIVKFEREVPLRAMPDTEDLTRKEILGVFTTVSEAEYNYEKQVEKAQEGNKPKERMLGYKSQEELKESDEKTQVDLEVEGSETDTRE